MNELHSLVLFIYMYNRINDCSKIMRVDELAYPISHELHQTQYCFS